MNSVTETSVWIQIFQWGHKAFMHEICNDG